MMGVELVRDRDTKVRATVVCFMIGFVLLPPAVHSSATAA